MSPNPRPGRLAKPKQRAIRPAKHQIPRPTPQSQSEYLSPPTNDGNELGHAPLRIAATLKSRASAGIAGNLPYPRKLVARNASISTGRHAKPSGSRTLPPGYADAQHVQDAVDHLTQVRGPGIASGGVVRQEGSQFLPLGVGQITGIRFSAHATSVTTIPCSPREPTVHL